MTSAQDRVQAGMAWLDEAYPDHVKTFNPSEFDIMNRGDARGFNRCALMQATGLDYWSDAQELAGLDDTRVQDLGFFPVGRHPLSIGRPAFRQDTDDLNAAWLDAYAERQAA